MKQLRDASDPFNSPENFFKQMFRFTTHLARDVFLQLHPLLDNGQRNTGIAPVIQFFVALHFYAHGSYQKSIGKDRDLSMSQASVSRCLHHVTTTIVEHFAVRFIKFPQTDEEILNVKNGFFEQFGLPGVLGAVDGTHIAIVPPPFGGIPPSLVYVNRIFFYSINCQIICDANLNILSVNSRYPGSVHDSGIRQMSRIFRI